MAGEAVKVQSVFLPAPTGGLNYVDNPAALQPNEARQLHNYLVFSWGIQQRSKEEAHIASGTYANSYLYPYWDSGIEKMIVYAAGSFYRLDNEVDTTPTSLGLAARSGTPPVSCYFNKRIFFFNAKEVPVNFTISTGTAANASFTGPTGGGTDLGYGWTYKSRMYAFEKTDFNASAVPTRVWYTNVDAISGAMTSIDFASIFTSNCSIKAGFSWSVNQGIQSEELFCLLGDTGEMLIYSGDSPESPNWQLIARIPAPLPLDNDKILKIGQETYINTVLGLLPMSALFAARVGAGLEKASLSRKLGGISLGKSTITRWCPFAFILGEEGIFCLNYEEGSWSYWGFFGAIDTIVDVACMGSNLFFSTPAGISKVVLPRGSHYIDGNAEDAVTSIDRCIWKTPFLDFGTQAKKKISRIKIIGTDLSVSQVFSNSAYVKEQYQDDTTDFTYASRGTDSATQDVFDNTLSYRIRRLYEQEIRPPGSGSRLSICFNKAPSSQINEIYGIEVMYETGGMYG